MFRVGKKQEIARALAITSGSGQEIGLVRGTLGAIGVLARIFNGNAAATLSNPGVRPSWDGATNLPSSVVTSAMMVLLDSRDVNGLAAGQGLYFFALPGSSTALQQFRIPFPALMLVAQPSANVTIDVDAWVLYDLAPEQNGAKYLTESLDFQPLLPS